MAKDHDMQYVEFGTIDGDYFVQALGYNPHIPLHSDPLELKRYVDSMGLKVSQLDAAYPMSCPEGQHRGIGYTIRSIQFAKAIGCPCVDTTDGGKKAEGYTDQEAMALMRQYYRVVLEWAQRYDIIINVEPHGPYTTDPDTMEQILGFSDSPYLRMNMDTGNTFIAGQNPVSFCERFKKKVTHVHVKDVSKSLAAAVLGKQTGIAVSNCAIGDGVNPANIRKVLTILRDIGFNGVLSMECEGAGGPMIEKSLAWLRRTLRELDIPTDG